MPKRTSIRRVAQTGEPAPSWTPDPALSALANECFRSCVNPHAKPDLIRVFRNNSDGAVQGRCYTEERIITLWWGLCEPLETLAHEIAHLRFLSHGKRHAALTVELHGWLKQKGTQS